MSSRRKSVSKLQNSLVLLCEDGFSTWARLTLVQALGGNFGVCSHFFSVSPQTTRNCVVGFLKKILQHPFAPTLPRRACTRVSPFVVWMVASAWWRWWCWCCWWWRWLRWWRLQASDQDNKTSFLSLWVTSYHNKIWIIVLSEGACYQESSWAFKRK